MRGMRLGGEVGPLYGLRITDNLFGRLQPIQNAAA